MSTRRSFGRGELRVVVALALLVPPYLMSRLPELDGRQRAEIARRFAFERKSIDVPREGPERASRDVSPAAARVAGWINVLGASAALADLDGNGLPDDLCLGDPRRNRIFVLPVPESGARYAPFALDPSPLRFDDRTMAPMGARCADVDEDGRLDVLVYFWGRTPIVFARRDVDGSLGPHAFEPVEALAGDERWFSNAATFADVDGDGHADLIVGNYFADGARVLDPDASDAHEMHDSMSRASNGALHHVLRGTGSRSQPFTEWTDALAPADARGWTLALGAADLDDDLLPELYFANDFGSDQLFHNRSAPGRVTLAPLHGVRQLGTPRSKVLGGDSFKGMGVDLADIDGDGRLDLLVSNITTEFGLMESQFVWVSSGPKEWMQRGIAPYVDRSEELGLSRSGWAWDARWVDCDNDGTFEAIQALGFLHGDVNRWPELHEIATAADFLVSDPGDWHHFSAGDDLSGRQHPAFFARAADARYYEIGADVGLGDAQVSRAVAVADVDGDGDPDLVLANQWQDSFLYVNRAAAPGAWLGLRLLLPPRGAPPSATRALPGRPAGLCARPAFGAHARVRLADGRLLAAEVDGGNGHSGARSPELLFGLGAVPAQTELEVELAWRDEAGRVRQETQRLQPGWHTLILGAGEVRR